MTGAAHWGRTSDRSGPRVIVALDFPDRAQASELVAQLHPAQCRLKIGKELFCRAGPTFVRDVIHRGFDVFLDLKFHDIPNTVAAACRAVADLGVWMTNVHALGGAEMMRAAKDALSACDTPPYLIAVTVLTSHSEATLRQVGIDHEPLWEVSRLAELARDAGLDGVVCSAREVAVLRGEFGERPLLVTPGIRPAAAVADDQRRVMTPREALRAGADFLVVGRPITRAAKPADALSRINSDVANLTS